MVRDSFIKQVMGLGEKSKPLQKLISSCLRSGVHNVALGRHQAATAAESLTHRQQSTCRTKAVKSRATASCPTARRKGLSPGTLGRSSPGVTKRVFRRTPAAWHHRIDCRCLLHAQSFPAPPPQREQVLHKRRRCLQSKNKTNPPTENREEPRGSSLHAWRRGQEYCAGAGGMLRVCSLSSNSGNCFCHQRSSTHPQYLLLCPPRMYLPCQVCGRAEPSLAALQLQHSTSPAPKCCACFQSRTRPAEQRAHRQDRQPLPSCPNQP